MAEIVSMSILSTVEFQMSLLLFVALAGYIIASRINQSAVIGEIFVGLLIGPSFFGLITYTDFVNSLAHLGAVILLFVVGLEFRLHDIVKAKYGIIALCGVIVPWIAGFYLAGLFGFNLGTAIFVGTALTATSIAITANVLKEMGKLQTEAAKAIIAAAVIDDVLSLFALSVSSGFVSGNISPLSLLFLLFKAFAFLAMSALAGHFLISRAMLKLDSSRTAQKYPELVFIFAMMVAFLYAMASELVGLSAIVGSFIAGVSLRGVGIKHSKNYKEGAEYLHIIFASLFFISLGILADFKAMTLNTLWFVVFLTVIAVLTKVVGCGLSARLTGMGTKDSLIVGFGMSPRGEVAMIVALLGLNQALIDQEIYVSIILMSLLTTILAPIILRNWLYKEKESPAATNPNPPNPS